MLAEKQLVIERLRSELDRMKLNNRLANTIVESPSNYKSITDVNARRMMASAGSLKQGKATATATAIPTPVASTSMMNATAPAPVSAVGASESSVSEASEGFGRSPKKLPYQHEAGVAALGSRNNGARSEISEAESSVSIKAVPTTAAGHFRPDNAGEKKIEVNLVPRRGSAQNSKRPKKRVVLQLKDLFD